MYIHAVVFEGKILGLFYGWRDYSIWVNHVEALALGGRNIIFQYSFDANIFVEMNQDGAFLKHFHGPLIDCRVVQVSTVVKPRPLFQSNRKSTGYKKLPNYQG